MQVAGAPRPDMMLGVHLLRQWPCGSRLALNVPGWLSTAVQQAADDSASASDSEMSEPASLSGLTLGATGEPTIMLHGICDADSQVSTNSINSS